MSDLMVTCRDASSNHVYMPGSSASTRRRKADTRPGGPGHQGKRVLEGASWREPDNQVLG